MVNGSQEIGHPNPPAGWYDNPEAASQERYWDGSAWTDDVRPAQSWAPPESEEDQRQLALAIQGHRRATERREASPGLAEFGIQNRDAYEHANRWHDNVYWPAHWKEHQEEELPASGEQEGDELVPPEQRVFNSRAEVSKHLEQQGYVWDPRQRGYVRPENLSPAWEDRSWRELLSLPGLPGGLFTLIGGAVTVVVLLGLGFAACGSAGTAAAGPTCGDFQEAPNDFEQQQMVLAWMKDQNLAAEDATMTSQGSGLAPLGVEVMGYVRSFEQECRVQDADTPLSDFSPS